MLSFDEYQAASAATAVYPERGTGSPAALAYVALGLGESGEVQGKVLDLLDGAPGASAEVRAELGDVLWYVAQLATELRVPLSRVAMLPGSMTQFQERVSVPGTSWAAAGLMLGVAGDLQGRVKKILRGDPATTDPRYIDTLVTDAGRLLAVIARLATLAQVSLAEVAQANLDKLADRAVRGVIRGAGDHR